MKSTSPASRLIAAVSRRSFFGRAAVAGSAVLLGSSIPSKVGAEDKKDKKEDKKEKDEKEESRHIVNGHVLRVFVVRNDGFLHPYDWKAPPTS